MQDKDPKMANETTNAFHGDRRRVARKSLLGLNAASAGRASAAAVTAFGLVLTGGVAANAAAGGPEQDRQSETLEATAPELNPEQTPSNSAEAQTTPQSAPSAELHFDGGITTASSSGNDQPASNGESSSSVVGAAYSGMGSPYSWGGTTPSGFDCSGFINWAYEQAGAGDLPRTTHGMEASLPEVSNPEPGDIVLANNSSHGGIYAGNGQVISATSSGVTTHDMNESWHQVNAIVSPS